MKKDKSCWTCEFIESFAWICCNGYSDYRGDNPPREKTFECWCHKDKKLKQGEAV